MTAMQRWSIPVLTAVAALACAATLWPFIHMIAWGAIVAVSCEPLVEIVSARVGGRGRAALCVALALALAVALPLAIAMGSAASQVGFAVEWIKGLLSHGAPLAPDWLARLPVVGAAAAEWWGKAVDGGAAPLIEWSKAHAGEAAGMAAVFAGGAASVAAGAVAALAVATLMMAHGSKIAAQTDKVAIRALGPSGPEWTALVAKAFRGVAVGVCGTALALSVCVALGLWAAGIPAVSLLFCVAMALCLAQIGPLPILVPAGLFLAMQGRYGAAIGLGILALALSALDGVMRPYLIGRQVRMSMLLIFSGVVGGLMAFGLIGLFVGPAALAVGSRLWSAFMAAPRPEGVAPAPKA